MIKYIIVTILFLLVPNTCLSVQLNWRSNLTELRAIPNSTTGDFCDIRTATYIYHYRFDSTITTSDNDFTVIKPLTNVGAWLLVSSYVNAANISNLDTVTNSLSRTLNLNCSNGQIPKVIDSIWVCSSDSDSIYVHPTTDGNSHVPATGTTSAGKILVGGASAGLFGWDTPPVASNSTDGYATAAQVSAIEANTAKVSYTPATPGPIGEQIPDTGKFTSITANVVTVPIPNGSTGELQLQEDPVNPGGNVVGFKAPANLPGDILWVLMSTDGNPGDCLKTTGAGVLYFAACSP